MSKIVGAHSGGRIGEILDHGSSSLPIYTLPCNGAAVSRTTYAALFAVIGTQFGVGDGSTTFNVPNGQALFKRGAGSQSVGGVARSATHAATANDTMQGHVHTVGQQYLSVFPGGALGASGVNSFQTPTMGGPTTDGTNGTPRTGAETAPVSLGVTYGIVWK